MARPGDKYFYRKYGARIDSFLQTIQSRNAAIGRIEQHVQRAEEILSILPKKRQTHLRAHLNYLGGLQDRYVYEVNLAAEGIRGIQAERELDEENKRRAARNRGIPVSQLLTEFEMVDLPLVKDTRPETPQLDDEERGLQILWYHSLRESGWERREAYKLATSSFEEISLAEINRIYLENKK